MTPTLYHYVHCPYCVRVRMAAGLLEISYKSAVLKYDDEKTPVDLIGKKICPIWVDESGKAMSESLDIIAKIDIHNKLKTSQILQSQEWKELEPKLNEIGSLAHNLAMPHWIYTKEFDEKSREYFQKKKEVKRGPFAELVKNRDLYEKELLEKLYALEKNLKPFYLSQDLGLIDILIASHIWGLYVVPEFQFSEKMHDYLQSVKKICRFDYHVDLWK